MPRSSASKWQRILVALCLGLLGCGLTASSSTAAATTATATTPINLTADAALPAAVAAHVAPTAVNGLRGGGGGSFQLYTGGAAWAPPLPGVTDDAVTPSTYVRAAIRTPRTDRAPPALEVVSLLT